MNKIKVGIKKPNEDLEIRYIEHSTEKLQEIVDGLYDCIILKDMKMIMVVNDEFLFRDFLPSIILEKENKESLIFGNAIFLNDSNDDTEASLTDMQIEILTEWIKEHEVHSFKHDDGSISVII